MQNWDNEKESRLSASFSICSRQRYARPSSAPHAEPTFAGAKQSTLSAPPITRAGALNDVERLISAFEMLEDGPVVTDSLVALCREVPVGGRQIHDANIAATMLAHGERGLLTFNPADFRRYGYRIELPGG